MGLRLASRCPGAAIGVVGNCIGDPLPNGIERRIRAGCKQLSRLISCRCSGRGSGPAQECIPAADRYGAWNFYASSIPIYGSGLHLYILACRNRSIGILRPIRPFVVAVHVVNRSTGIGRIGILVNDRFGFLVPPVVHERGAIGAIMRMSVNGSLRRQLIIQRDVLGVPVIPDGIGGISVCRVTAVMPHSLIGCRNFFCPNLRILVRLDGCCRPVRPFPIAGNLRADQRPSGQVLFGA